MSAKLCRWTRDDRFAIHGPISIAIQVLVAQICIGDKLEAGENRGRQDLSDRSETR